MKNQIDKANYFQNLHNDFFILPNAWNGGSAKVFDKSGFKAIGTTSAGIAYSLGFPDGEKIDFTDIVRVTKEILRVTNLPVSIDLERGYGKDIEEISANVEQIISLGAIGINIEDGVPEINSVDDLTYFSTLISRISDLKVKLKIPFVLNARTDIFLLNTSDNMTMLKNTIERSRILKDAGADVIFIPGALEEDTIIKLRENIELPINLFLHPQFNNIEKLKSIGINRLSSGSSPIRTNFNNLKELSSELQNWNCEKMLNHKFNYSNANRYFGE